MKEINSNNKKFDRVLESLLLKRRNKVKSSSVSVSKIINDIKKNGDKALLKYEKKFTIIGLLNQALNKSLNQ